MGEDERARTTRLDGSEAGAGCKAGFGDLAERANAAWVLAFMIGRTSLGRTFDQTMWESHDARGLVTSRRGRGQYGETGL